MTEAERTAHPHAHDWRLSIVDLLQQAHAAGIRLPSTSVFSTSSYLSMLAPDPWETGAIPWSTSPRSGGAADPNHPAYRHTPSLTEFTDSTPTAIRRNLAILEAGGAISRTSAYGNGRLGTIGLHIPLGRQYDLERLAAVVASPKANGRPLVSPTRGARNTSAARAARTESANRRKADRLTPAPRVPVDKPVDNRRRSDVTTPDPTRRPDTGSTERPDTGSTECPDTGSLPYRSSRNGGSTNCGQSGTTPTRAHERIDWMTNRLGYPPEDPDGAAAPRVFRDRLQDPDTGRELGLNPFGRRILGRRWEPDSPANQAWLQMQSDAQQRRRAV